MPLAESANEPAAARAYRALEARIVMLDLAPGTVTTESALLLRLGLGRTPVREAVQRLAWEGLLEIRPRAGIGIMPLHAGDWLKIIDARRGVEVLLARSAARNRTHGATDMFLRAASAMEQAVEAGDVRAFIDADKRLDEAIALAADNVFASRLAAPLQSHSRRFWFRYQASTGLVEAAERHLHLVHAIVAADEESAAAEADQLMGLLRRRALDALER